MASVKVVSLLIKTLSKPIASRLKISAQEHPKFNSVRFVSALLNPTSIRTRLASGIFFGKTEHIIRPLSDTKAIQNGANFLSEAFLFSVAVALIVAENLRGRWQTAHRRDVVDERLTELESLCATIRSDQESLQQKIEPLLLLYKNNDKEPPSSDSSLVMHHPIAIPQSPSDPTHDRSLFSPVDDEQRSVDTPRLESLQHNDDTDLTMRSTLVSILATSLLMMLTSRGVSAVPNTVYLCARDRNSICIRTPDGAQTFPDLDDFSTFLCQAASTYGICCYGPPGQPVPVNAAMGNIVAPHVLPTEGCVTTSAIILSKTRNFFFSWYHPLCDVVNKPPRISLSPIAHILAPRSCAYESSISIWMI
ncbi:hypothetical protein H4Q26_003317 [Puccinia striiformis f. sp. tritici PST-130]|nr:hypothetical protein H4Q26_003317 [Puccinia striiformis f. sp. tritici PST-130]